MIHGIVLLKWSTMRGWLDKGGGNMDKLAEYGKKLNNYVLKNEGDIFKLKKLADELNRDFYKDIIELKVGYNL